MTTDITEFKRNYKCKEMKTDQTQHAVTETFCGSLPYTGRGL